MPTCISIWWAAEIETFRSVALDDAGFGADTTSQREANGRLSSTRISRRRTEETREHFVRRRQVDKKRLATIAMIGTYSSAASRKTHNCPIASPASIDCGMQIGLSFSSVEIPSASRPSLGYVPVGCGTLRTCSRPPRRSASPPIAPQRNHSRVQDTASVVLVAGVSR